MPRKSVICEKREIIEVAYRIVDAEGVAALSTRRIAKEMNVSFMTLYNYVDNMGEIKKEVMLEGFRVLYRAAYKALENGKRSSGNLSIGQSCRILAIQLFQFACQHKGVYQLMLDCNDSHLRSDPEIAPYHGYFLQLLKRSESSREVKRYNRALQMLNYVVYGLIGEKLHGIRDYALEDYLAYVDDYVRQMLERQGG